MPISNFGILLVINQFSTGSELHFQRPLRRLFDNRLSKPYQTWYKGRSTQGLTLVLAWLSCNFNLGAAEPRLKIQVCFVNVGDPK